MAIEPAPAKGVLFLPASALRVASIALRNPGTETVPSRSRRSQFRYGFGNALSEQESDELWEQWTIPSPGKPLFEAALANLEPHSPAAVDRKSATRGPLLITAGGKDHTVPGGGQPADAEALPQVAGHHRSAHVRRPGPFADDRQWLA